MSGPILRFLLQALTLTALVAVCGVDAVWPHLRDAPRSPAGREACTCETAKPTNGWCGACSVGYVASLRIPSASLFELVDAHGHEVDLTHVSCLTCHRAMETDGFCESHAIGYSAGRAYVSRLAHLLARGDPVQTSQDYLRLQAALRLLDTCEFCALAAFANGRCPQCNVHYRDGERTLATAGKAEP